MSSYRASSDPRNFLLYHQEAMKNGRTPYSLENKDRQHPLFLDRGDLFRLFRDRGHQLLVHGRLGTTRGLQTGVQTLLTILQSHELDSLSFRKD